MRTAVAILSIILASTSIAQTPARYAVLVGVGKYEHSRLDALPFAERDVGELAPILQKNSYAVRLLTNSAASELRPTLANIDRELSVLLGRPDQPGRQGVRGKVRAGDLVLIALAGHGVQPAEEKEGYFCPVDADPQVKSTLLSIGGLIRRLDDSGAGAKLLLVDACRNDPDPSRGRGVDGASLQALPRGVAALFSCSPGQRAFETPKAGGGHGVFFHFVIEGLKGEAKNSRGEVTWARLAEHVTEKVGPAVKEWVGPTVDQMPGEFKNILGASPVLVARSNAADTAATEITNTIGLKLRLIPAGEFTMGGDWYDNEKPKHQVRITKAYYLGKTEVTQGQWKAVMGTEPWKGQECVKEGNDYPVTCVSWEDATEFCRKLSEKEGRTYRLPTEAEWEYACRGGADTEYGFGDDTASLDAYAWFFENAWDAGEKYAHEVGLKKPNAFGLHDMHGNVREWCSDRFGENYYAESPSEDPKGPTTDAERLVRGGSWDLNAQFLRAAYRYAYDPARRYTSVGFRCALVQ